MRTMHMRRAKKAFEKFSEGTPASMDGFSEDSRPMSRNIKDAKTVAIL